MPDPMLWPFPARQPGSEVLEWRTDILASREGEQRIALRPVPREVLTFRHLLDASGMARAAELARIGFADEWLVPFWVMASPLGADVADTDMTIPMVTQYADYRAPGYAVLAADGGDAVLVEVSQVFSDRLELAESIGVNLTNAIVAPVRRAVLTGPVEIDRRRQGQGIATATFRLLDSADLSGISGAAIIGISPYLGRDVLIDPTVMRQPLRDTIGQTVEMVDNGFGPVVIEPTRAYLQRRSTITFSDYGAAPRWSRRRWLHGLRGRQRAFWLPTWGRELVLHADVLAGDDFLIVAPTLDLTTWINRHIMFDLPTGGMFRKVIAASFDALGHRLTIAASGVDVPAVTPVHVLTKMRLDTDRIELEHSATRTELSATVIEVPV